MTGPKGNSEIYFPETLNVPRGETASRGTSHKALCYTAQLKNRKKKLLRFQGARPDHV